MAGMGSISYAAKLRDIIEDVASKTVDRMRPEYKIGKVWNINIRAGRADILFAGELPENTVSVKFGPDQIPVRLMVDNYATLGMDSPGDIVRVSGSPGRYYISGFISGAPMDQFARPAMMPMDVSGSVSLDSRSAVVYRLSLTGSNNISAMSFLNPFDGAELCVMVRVDATGGHTVAWPTDARFAGGSAPSAFTNNTCTSVTFRFSSEVSLWLEVGRAVNVPTV